jgi:hypothetical protein
MRMLLLSAVLASGVGLTGTASTSASITSGIASKAAADFTPRLRLAAKGCREECDQNGDNCRQVCQ